MTSPKTVAELWAELDAANARAEAAVAELNATLSKEQAWTECIKRAEFEAASLRAELEDTRKESGERQAELFATARLLAAATELLEESKLPYMGGLSFGEKRDAFLASQSAPTRSEPQLDTSLMTPEGRERWDRMYCGGPGEPEFIGSAPTRTDHDEIMAPALEAPREAEIVHPGHGRGKTHDSAGAAYSRTDHERAVLEAMAALPEWALRRTLDASDPRNHALPACRAELARREAEK